MMKGCGHTTSSISARTNSLEADVLTLKPARSSSSAKVRFPPDFTLDVVGVVAFEPDEVVVEALLLLQAANTSAAPAIRAPSCIPLLSFLTPWTSSVPSPSRGGLPCRKVTRTLPFLCDFRWDSSENWEL